MLQWFVHVRRKKRAQKKNPKEKTSCRNGMLEKALLCNKKQDNKLKTFNKNGS